MSQCIAGGDGTPAPPQGETSHADTQLPSSSKLSHKQCLSAVSTCPGPAILLGTSSRIVSGSNPRWRSIAWSSQLLGAAHPHIDASLPGLVPPDPTGRVTLVHAVQAPSSADASHTVQHIWEHAHSGGEPAADSPGNTLARLLLARHAHCRRAGSTQHAETRLIRSSLQRTAVYLPQLPLCVVTCVGTCPCTCCSCCPCHTASRWDHCEFRNMRTCAYHDVCTCACGLMHADHCIQAAAEFGEPWRHGVHPRPAAASSIINLGRRRAQRFPASPVMQAALKYTDMYMKSPLHSARGWLMPAGRGGSPASSCRGRHRGNQVRLGSSADQSAAWVAADSTCRH